MSNEKCCLALLTWIPASRQFVTCIDIHDFHHFQSSSGLGYRHADSLEWLDRKPHLGSQSTARCGYCSVLALKTVMGIEGIGDIEDIEETETAGRLLHFIRVSPPLNKIHKIQALHAR